MIYHTVHYRAVEIFFLWKSFQQTVSGFLLKIAEQGLANILKTSKFIYITCMSLDVANNVKQHNAMLQSVAAHNVRVPKR
jgi:hypothetical protein